MSWKPRTIRPPVPVGRYHARQGLELRTDPDHLRTANDGISVTARIKTPPAVCNAYEIAKVDGVDALFVGLSDLSATMGLSEQLDHHDVQTAFIQARGGASEHGKPFG